MRGASFYHIVAQFKILLLNLCEIFFYEYYLIIRYV